MTLVPPTEAVFIGCVLAELDDLLEVPVADRDYWFEVQRAEALERADVALDLAKAHGADDEAEQIRRLTRRL